MNDLNLYRELEALRIEIREQKSEVVAEIAKLRELLKTIFPFEPPKG